MLQNASDSDRDNAKTQRAGGPTVENTASKQTPEVKSAELGNRQYGTPLYIPQPNSKLSKPDRRDGIRPGCVGKITKSGSFDVIHNSIFRSLTTSDTGTPINQMPFDDEDIVEFKQFSAGSFLATPGIYRKSLDGGSLRLAIHLVCYLNHVAEHFLFLIIKRTIASLGCDVDTQEGALLILPGELTASTLPTCRSFATIYRKVGPAFMHMPTMFEVANLETASSLLCTTAIEVPRGQ